MKIQELFPTFWLNLKLSGGTHVQFRGGSMLSEFINQEEEKLKQILSHPSTNHSQFFQDEKLSKTYRFLVGGSILSWAFEHRNMKLVKFLLENGATASSVDNVGKPLLVKRMKNALSLCSIFSFLLLLHKIQIEKFLICWWIMERVYWNYTMVFVHFNLFDITV